MAAKKDSAQKKDVQESIAEKNKSIEQVLGSMQVKLKELDAIRADLYKEQFTGISPQQSKQMLEEIVVPSLDFIRDEKKAKTH